MSRQQPGLASPHNAGITREPFLFYEMRITAGILAEGASDAETIDRIVQENLFQYPTERSVKRMAAACIRRLHGMDDPDLITAIAAKPQDVSRQIWTSLRTTEFAARNVL